MIGVTVGAPAGSKAILALGRVEQMGTSAEKSQVPSCQIVKDR